MTPILIILGAIAVAIAAILRLKHVEHGRRRIINSSYAEQLRQERACDPRERGR